VLWLTTQYNPRGLTRPEQSSSGEPFLRIERSQLRWFSYMARISQGRLARQLLLAIHMRKWPRGRTRTRWSNYISDLACSRHGVEPAELSEASTRPPPAAKLNKIVALHPIQQLTEVGQGQGGVTTSPALLGTVLVRNQ